MPSFADEFPGGYTPTSSEIREATMSGYISDPVDIQAAVSMGAISAAEAQQASAAATARAINSSPEDYLPDYSRGNIGVGAGAMPVNTPLPAAAVQPQGPPVVDAALAALSTAGVVIPEPVTTILGAAGLAYTGAQALGLGEGEGLFGNNLLGGDNSMMGGVPFGGPGLAEPDAKYLIKEWHVNYDWGRLQYYLVANPSGKGRKIFLYNTKTKKWKWWSFRTPRLAVIGKNMPSHKQITRLRRNLSKHRADADTILRLTSPKYAAYKSRKRRH